LCSRYLTTKESLRKHAKYRCKSKKTELSKHNQQIIKVSLTTDKVKNEATTFSGAVLLPPSQPPNSYSWSPVEPPLPPLILPVPNSKPILPSGILFRSGRFG